MSKKTKIGKLGIGGKNPVRIKGMLKTSTSNIPKLIAEAKSLEREGVEAIRMAVKDEADAKLVKKIKAKISVPMVADIHFNYRLAIAAIENGFDSIRLNPRNIFKKEQVEAVVDCAKSAGISIRIGVNSGGFAQKFSSNKALARAMVREVEKYLRIFEKKSFFDTMVSLKASEVDSTIAANQEFAKRFDYPLHLGVTATGPFSQAIVKSSLGIGILLSQGIGDVIRVSLTAPSFWEIRVAKYILQFLGKRKFFCELISCPTCSRCEVDLLSIVDKFSKEIEKDSTGLPEKVALMGCVVNGPGEAYQADIGVAFGKSKAAIFKKDKIVGYTNEKKVISDLRKQFKKK